MSLLNTEYTPSQSPSDWLSAINDQVRDLIRQCLYREVVAELHALDPELIALADDNKQGDMHLLFGNCYSNLGELERGYQSFQTALAFFAKSENETALAITHNNLANNCRMRGEVSEAREHLEISSSHFLKVGDRLRAAVVEGNLAVLLYNMGANEESRQCYSNSIHTLDELGAGEISTSFREQYVGLLDELDETEAANIEINIALEYAQTHGLRRVEASCIQTIGSMKFSAGDYSEARACFQQAILIAREIQNPRVEGSSMGDLALVDLVNGDLPNALRLVESAVQIIEPISDTLLHGTCEHIYGKVYFQGGAYDNALTRLNYALEKFRDFGSARFVSNVSYSIGILHFVSGEPLDGQFWLESAIETDIHVSLFAEAEESTSVLLFFLLIHSKFDSTQRWQAWLTKRYAKKQSNEASFHRYLGQLMLELHDATRKTPTPDWHALWESSRANPTGLSYHIERLYTFAKENNIHPGTGESIILTMLQKWLIEQGIDEPCFKIDTPWDRSKIIALQANEETQPLSSDAAEAGV